MGHRNETLLVIVGGAPASGKSSLARRLSRDLRIPAFGKDDFKETLFDRLGCHDREWSRSLGEASYDLLILSLRKLLNHGVSCIVESAFRPSDSRVFEDIRRSCAPRIVQVFCHAPLHELRERFRQRVASGQRHPGHRDESNTEELDRLIESGTFAPLEVEGELIRINTGAAYAGDFRSTYQAILSSVSGG